MPAAAAPDLIVVEVQPQRFNARMVFQILLQRNRNNIRSLGFIHTGKGEKMVLPPVAPFKQLQRCKAQKVDRRFKQMDGIALAGIAKE